MEDNELNKYSNRLDGEEYAKLKERMEYVLSDEAFEDMVQNAIKNHDEPKLNYDDFYKLTGRKLTGKISHSSSYKIDAKLNEIIDELEEELNDNDEDLNNKYSNRLDGGDYAKLKERMGYVLSDKAIEDMVQNAIKNKKEQKDSVDYE